MNTEAVARERRPNRAPDAVNAAVSIEANALRRFAADVLQHAGVAPEEAAIVSDCLVDADLRGIASHGVARLPAYVDALLRRFIQPKPLIRIHRTTPATAVVDGGDGLGSLVAVRAMREAISLAANNGIGMVTVRRSSPFGHAGYFASIAAAANCLGIVISNGPATVAPFGGRQALLGTNPIAMAAPGAGIFDFVLDMSTSFISRGRLRLAARYNEPIPEGCAIARDGTPARGAREAMSGIQLPFGGYKGSGLAMMIDLIAGVLSGAGFGTRVRSMYGPGEGHADVGNALIAIRISAFIDPSDYESRYHEWYRAVKASEPAPGNETVRIPGESSARIAARQLCDGITLDRETWQALQQLAASLGIPEESKSTPGEIDSRLGSFSAK